MGVWYLDEAKKKLDKKLPKKFKEKFDEKFPEPTTAPDSPASWFSSMTILA